MVLKYKNRDNNQKNKKKILNICLRFFLMLLFTIIYIYIYNEAIKPFAGYNKKILINNNEYNSLDKKYYDFYNDFINYKEYENKYETNFYYKYGKKALFLDYTLQYTYNTLEAYSYIIKVDDYNNQKDNIINKYNYVRIPIGYSIKKEFIDDVKIGDWTFKELYYNITMNSSDYLISRYENQIRTRSYWLSYNDNKKEICFSVLINYERVTDYETIIDLQKYLINNLYM